MIKLTDEGQKVSPYLKNQIQLTIPVTQKADFTIAGLYSSVQELATLRWNATDRQLYMRSVSEDTDENSFSFLGHGRSANQPLLPDQPASGQFLMASNQQAITFCNDPLTTDLRYDIYNNGDILIIDDCTITNHDFTQIVSFDLSLKFVGDQTLGKNILMLASDAIEGN